MLNEEEFKQLAAGPHIFGVYKYPIYTQPQLTMYTLPPAQPVYTRDRYNDGFGGFGVGSHGSGGRQTSASSFAPPATTPLQAMIQRVDNSGPAMPSAVPLSMNIGITAGGGNTNVFADLTMKSPLDSLMVGMNYSTGESGRSLGMFSQYNQDMGAYISAGGKGQLPTAGSLSSLAQTHLAASKLITQLADGSRQMNAEGGMSSNMSKALQSMKIGASHLTTGTIFMGFGLAQKASEGGQEALKARNRQNANAAAPGMPPEDPEKKGKEEKEKHYEVPKSQAKLREFIENADRVGSGLKGDPYHRASSFGSQRTANIEVKKIIGGDGKPYVRLVQEAVVNDQKGIFEYLVNSEGKITHQLFMRM